MMIGEWIFLILFVVWLVDMVAGTFVAVKGEVNYFWIVGFLFAPILVAIAEFMGLQ